MPTLGHAKGRERGYQTAEGLVLSMVHRGGGVILVVTTKENHTLLNTV